MKYMITLLKIVIIILLVLAISLQLSFTKLANVKLDDLVHNPSSTALDDFFASSAARTVRNTADDAQSIDKSDPKNIQFTHVSKNAGSRDTEIIDTKSLSCIDVVQRCEKFINESLPSTINLPASEEKTLALAAPMLKGGYRNQYMRFVALVGNALIDRQNILLPSIKWHSEKGGHNTVPFEMLFDLDEWNRHKSLPKLVKFNESIHHQWNPTSTVFVESCNNVINYFRKPHRTSILKGLEGRTQPYALGGAISGQPGNLWDFYRRRDKDGWTFDTPEASLTLQKLEEWVLSAMKPSPIVMKLVNSIRPPNQPYIALHPRIEPEMMEHAHCKEEKVRSMPYILEQVLSYKGFDNYTSMFVAVAMPQMTVEHHLHPRYPYSKDHRVNLETLRSIFSEGIDRPNGNSHIDVWTAGESSLEERKVDSCMIQLLASIINMELALEADVFVGTSVSTWSNSVWKIRHWRGLPNYEFTNNGIKRVEGLPPPFVC